MELELTRSLTDRDLLLCATHVLPYVSELIGPCSYFGHGGAEQYIRSSAVRRLISHSVVMLWGCSSGALHDQGDFGRTGTPYNYMIGGVCVGTLPPSFFNFCSYTLTQPCSRRQPLGHHRRRLRQDGRRGLQALGSDERHRRRERLSWHRSRRSARGLHSAVPQWCCGRALGLAGRVAVIMFSSSCTVILHAPCTFTVFTHSIACCRPDSESKHSERLGLLSCVPSAPPTALSASLICGTLLSAIHTALCSLANPFIRAPCLGDLLHLARLGLNELQRPLPQSLSSK